MTRDNIRTLLLGPFADGEIPETQTVRFSPQDKDLTGYVLTVGMERDGVSVPLPNSQISWVDEVTGVAGIDFVDGDLHNDTAEPVEYWIQLWADDAGSPTIATLDIRFFVKRAIGAGKTGTP